MAKSKKSKILAMALCASVMAGIYAAPVMAAAIDVSDTSTLEVDGTKYTITSGTLNLDGGDILDSLKGKTLDFGYGSHIYTDSIHTGSYININQTYLRADPNNRNALIIGGTIDGYGVVKGGTTFDFLETNNKLTKISYDPDSNTTNFASQIHTTGSVTAKGTLSVADGDFKVDENGNITTVGTVDGVDVSAIGTNTAGITRENVTKNITKTNIENSSITSAGELYINKANGQTNFSVDKYGNANVRNNLIANGISVNNDRFTVDKNGTVHSDGTVYSERDFKLLIKLVI